MQRIIASVGAFVLQTQKIEHLFKFLLPMMNSDDPSLGAILKRQASLSKKTLGTLAEQFVNASTGKTDALEAYVRQLVDDRNEVVHHFTERFGALIGTEKYDDVLTQLRDRRERASALGRVLRASAFAVTEALRHGAFSGTEKYEEMADLCRQLRASLDSKVAVLASSP
jgi:hypothetical protein